MNLINHSKKIGILLAVIGFIGFLDAAYLSIKHYIGSPVTCSLLKGCEIVTTSQYSTIFNIPISVPGALYYLVVLVLAIDFLLNGRVRNIKWIAILATLALGFSAYLMYLQFFVIKAVCEYCIFSALTTVVLFITSWWSYKKLNQTKSQP